MNVDIRPWCDGDEASIVELFEIVFGRPMTLDFWRWRYLDHPSGGPLIMLGWSGDQLVGHYGASQAPLCIDGEVVPAALSMTSMTHPEHRGTNLFIRLGDALYEQLMAQDHVAAWGFPNAMAHQVRLSRLGWIDVYETPTLTLEAGQARIRGGQDAKVVATSEVDARFDNFAQHIADQKPIAAARGRDILRWRMDSNPVANYDVLVMEAGEDIAGYVATKRYGTDAMDIVELRAEDNAAARALLSAVVTQGLADGVLRWHTWCTPWDPVRSIFERSGFSAGGPVTYFGGRVFAPPSIEFGDARNWRLSMLDSDLY